MSFALTPSKRPHDRSSWELNGKGKWQKSANFSLQSQALKISPRSTVFRVLCPASKTGGVIGKGGNVISQIRQETGAKVRVEETVPGCDERVISIAGSDKETEASNEQNKEGGEDSNNNITEESDEAEEHEENSGDKESSPAADSQTGKATSSVQKALLLVFETMVEGEPDECDEGDEGDEGDEESKEPSCFVVRLLVLSSQVGCILGKGGSVIKQIAAESGAQIRILPRDKLPLCASQADELVQLTGGLDAVRKALQCVSQQLLENPPRDRDSFPARRPTGPSSNPFGPPFPKSEAYPPPAFRFPAQGPYAAGPLDGVDYASPFPPSIPKFHDNFIPGGMKPSQEILIFRLLCHNEKVGGVIGKGGTIIKTLKLETGCDVKILEGVPDSDDRIIVISGPAIPDERISAAQDAVLRVQARLVRAVPDKKEKIVLAQLLVSSSQIGCLLGKGGSIIAEMRKASGAQIRILGKDQIPKCASENEEVVQITGEFEAVQEALLQITSRLKHHLFRDAFSSINHPSHPAFPDQAPSFPSYVGRRELSPSGMFPNLGPSFHKFEHVGGLPHHGRIHPHDERSAFVHSIHRPGIPPHSSERLPSSAPWGPQARTDGGGPVGVSEYPGGPQRRTGVHGGGSQPAIITNTTMEVVVPRSLVPSIYGEDGGCLKQIRQISGANITITEPRPGDTETVIIISGAPDQTHAAQSLLQAFVMSGADSS
ncbi:KH domain-containing protein HEN4-like [Macadamia integrifolia]|uniref:KH domain-containing protein HEN4-like n=1 Tax=Macadamia integrifolia TaxID=60698 RepID=UPI001C4E81C2|nr:KH domain-containing protein HEN4-like [Macadamia integrifolia]XP_042508733.1 KH domain-containing protein HEN4-like [Macadamia integrifolia]XP_042508734.1 KH domain-containing protein HEN4-like [Macadamia integrifolia]XP_042508735.1 KH domain-containing protein HEN4-like [Macadamia integrifolia]XP_042508736.1 KH domain-containing protein HEN4-like [Macadamia integrifolia]XP_042508737.1 KH domain-containing protein HEN4-like [Macadamia integrifolia]XP_042508738.1 KH domain-containing prote